MIFEIGCDGIADVQLLSCTQDARFFSSVRQRMIDIEYLGRAFFYCTCASLTDVKFGNKLETMGESAFNNCLSLRKIQMKSVLELFKMGLFIAVSS
jgi:hypothetical protein